MSFQYIYSILIFISSVIGVVLSYEFLVLRFQQAYKTAKKLPAPKIYPFIGNVYQLVLAAKPDEAFRLLRQNALDFKATYIHYFMGYLIVNIVRGKDAELLLSSTKHIDKNWIYEFLHPFLGTGLLTSNGPKWFQRRKILTPAFHFNILQQFHSVFINQTDALVKNLKQNLNNSDGIALQDFIPRFTLNTICESAMGVNIGSLIEPDEYQKNIHEIGKLIVYRIMHPWMHFRVIYLLALSFKKKLQIYAKEARSFSRNIIKQRRELFRNGNIKTDFNYDENIYETKKTRHAMLDSLLTTEMKGQIDNEGIGEEVDTFMFEGHDTTASGLMGILLLLAHHPESQELILEEIKQEKEKSNEDDLSAKQYSNMKYFDRVIKECLRIYPPVSYIGREIKEQTEINNQIYPAGTCFQFHIYDIHRDPEQFPDPEKFDPDRFLQENIEKRHYFSYIPFSAGPRNCIGQKFAMLEIKTLIAKIIWNFNILPITKREDVVFVSDIVLRAVTPIKVKFSLRN